MKNENEQVPPLAVRSNDGLGEVETETIDRLFLELSQVTRATTGKEIALQRKLDKLHKAVLPFVRLVRETSGRIPHERLSANDWHMLVKAYDG